jgi:mono/diheme cytochrome c family protein
MAPMFMRASVAVVIALVACGKGDKPPPPGGAPLLAQESGPAPRAAASHGRGAQLFATSCAACHGVDGRGKTEMAKNLNPPPRDYSDPAWQSSVTDDELRAIIVRGGAAVGKSSMMPPNPTLANDRATLDELVQIVRGFARK